MRSDCEYSILTSFDSLAHSVSWRFVFSIASRSTVKAEDVKLSDALANLFSTKSRHCSTFKVSARTPVDEGPTRVGLYLGGWACEGEHSVLVLRVGVWPRISRRTFVAGTGAAAISTLAEAQERPAVPPVAAKFAKSAKSTNSGGGRPFSGRSTAAGLTCLGAGGLRSRPPSSVGPERVRGGHEHRVRLIISIVGETIAFSSFGAAAQSVSIAEWTDRRQGVRAQFRLFRHDVAVVQLSRPGAALTVTLIAPFAFGVEAPLRFTPPSVRQRQGCERRLSPHWRKMPTWIRRSTNSFGMLVRSPGSYWIVSRLMIPERMETRQTSGAVFFVYTSRRAGAVSSSIRYP